VELQIIARFQGKQRGPVSRCLLLSRADWLQRRIVLRSAYEVVCDLKRGSQTVLTKKEVWYEAGLTRLHTNSLYRTLGLF
jgi:hypothetical protein